MFEGGDVALKADPYYAWAAEGGEGAEALGYEIQPRGRLGGDASPYLGGKAVL